MRPMTRVEGEREPCLADLRVVQTDIAKYFEERRTRRIDKIINNIRIEPVADVEGKFAHGGRAQAESNLKQKLLSRLFELQSER